MKSLKTLKTELLADVDTRAEFEALAPEFEAAFELGTKADDDYQPTDWPALASERPQILLRPDMDRFVPVRAIRKLFFDALERAGVPPETVFALSFRWSGDERTGRSRAERLVVEWWGQDKLQVYGPGGLDVCNSSDDIASGTLKLVDFQKFADAVLGVDVAVVGDTPPATSPAMKAVPRRQAQDAAILDALRELGLDPLRMPLPPKGKACPVKTDVRKACHWMTKAVFEKAWQRLRDDDAIGND